MDATTFSLVVSISQIKSSFLSPRKSAPNIIVSCSQIRTHIPPFSYKCRLSSPGSYTILPSVSMDNQSCCFSEFSHCPPKKRSNGVGKTFCSAAVYTSSYDKDLAEALLHVAEEKIGVLLLNLGGPEMLNDVQPFLFNLFADPDIIRLPMLFRFLQRPLAQLISMLRASKSKEGYASIGGGSPLRKITDEQANAIKLALETKNKNVSVYVAMRYWFPFTEEAVQQVLSQQC